MGSTHEPTPVKQLAAQLEHPNAKAVWSRALEVFGDEGKARNWMNTPRDIFGGRSPDDLVATGNSAEQRRVLEVLLRIDYGVFS
jgi:putative toxin-antitoxin system antitoxin component (TIGR02293 family)